jgi:uncharacterized protein (DUF2336 family)
MPNPAANNGEKPTNPAAQECTNVLICQITDGFLAGTEQRQPKDVRPFEELLTHLFPRADLFTRSTVSQKLAKRRDLPRRIVTLLLQDDVAIAEPLAMHSPLLLTEDVTMLIARNDPILCSALLKRDDLSLVQKQALVLNIPSLQPAVKAAAQPVAEIKPLIINIPREFPAQSAAAEIRIAAQTEAPIILPPAAPKPAASPQLMQNMVRAAVLRRSADLAVLIAKELDLSPVITQALLKDESGEALIAACHYLNIPEDASMQVATLLYPALSRTREQLVSLRKAYRAFGPQATGRIVEAWRTLPQNLSPQHETVHASTSKLPGTATPAPLPALGEKIASNR